MLRQMPPVNFMLNIYDWRSFAFALFILLNMIFFIAYSSQLQDTKTTSGETEVKFQVSRDTLGSMLRSMAYIHEQLWEVVSIFFV